MKLVKEVTATTNDFYQKGENLGNGGLLIKKRKPIECHICNEEIKPGEQYIKHDSPDSQLEDLEALFSRDSYKSLCLGCVTFEVAD